MSEVAIMPHIDNDKQNNEYPFLEVVTKRDGGQYVKVHAYELAKYMLQTEKIYRDKNRFMYYNHNEGIWESDTESYLKQEITKLLKEHTKINNVRETLEHIKNISYVKNRDEIIDFDHNIFALTLSNGTYYFKEKKFVPLWNPYDYSTTKVNIKFDESMLSSGDTLPTKVYAYLGNILKKPELKFIFEWLGFCMVKGYPLQKLLILHGSGGNGKSTLINFISGVIGSENTSNLSLDTLQNDRFGKAHLKGKMLNACADISDTFFESMATIKEITGDDKSYAEFKGQNGFSFLNFAKLIFSANSLPSFKDTSEGLVRRLILLPMKMKPEPIDVNLNDILGDSQELTRTLLHAIESFERVLENGKFSISEEMNQALTQWLDRIDNVSCFISDECILEPGLRVKKTTLYAEYRYYCADNHFKDLGRNKFYALVSARYNLGEFKSVGDPHYSGIGLKTNM